MTICDWLLLLPSLFAVGSEDWQDRTNVFVSGQGGYHTYRIPAMVVTPNDTILAFCEGRRNSPADDGDIDLVLKRSTDQGRTWSASIVVHAERGDVTIGNPCPLVDARTGHVHLLFTRNNKRMFYTKSEDQGRTWAEPVEQTHVLENVAYPWVRIGTGPVHGIQASHGRLIAPIWLSNRERENRNAHSTKDRYRSAMLFSDDQGATWEFGGLVPAELNRLNEATVVERINGNLLLNMRAHGEGFRAVAVSKDGGHTWSTPVLDLSLPCPTCQASVLRLRDNEVVFSNPAASNFTDYDAPSRRAMTVRLSLDDAKTWPHSRLLHQGPAAYSDLAVLSDGTILCLFENGDDAYHERITIARLRRRDIVNPPHRRE
jgi:sialidase-1